MIYSLEQVISDIMNNCNNTELMSKIVKLDTLKSWYSFDVGEITGYGKPMYAEDYITESDNFHRDMIEEIGDLSLHDYEDFNVVHYNYVKWCIEFVIDMNKITGELTFEKENRYERSISSLILSLVMFGTDGSYCKNGVVAKIGEQVVATASITNFEESYVYIELLCSCGNHYGKKLLQELNRDTRLELHAVRTAMPYYKSIGFKEVFSTKLYAEPNSILIKGTIK